MISLAGKAALITGGSRGIGAAAVKLFAQAGADVVFNYNKAKEPAMQVEQDARKHGTRVEAFKVDVGRHAAILKLADDAGQAAVLLEHLQRSLHHRAVALLRSGTEHVLQQSVQ